MSEEVDKKIHEMTREEIDQRKKEIDYSFSHGVMDRHLSDREIDALKRFNINLDITEEAKTIQDDYALLGYGNYVDIRSIQLQINVREYKKEKWIKDFNELPKKTQLEIINKLILIDYCTNELALNPMGDLKLVVK